MAAATSKLPGVFTQAAQKLDVDESDFLVMVNDGIDSFDSLFFRLPSEKDLEGYLEDVVLGTAAYRDKQGKLKTFARPATMTWTQYKRSAEAASIRKLWHLAKQSAESELSRMGLTSSEMEKKAKVTLPTSAELEQKALARGSIPELRSDKERPSLTTLSKVSANYAANGEYRWLTWEAYFSQEEFESFGLQKSKRQALIVGGDKVTIQTEDGDRQVETIADLMRFQDAMRIRALAHDMLDLCPFAVLNKLTEKYLSSIRQTVPIGMRGATLGEVRLCDRNLWTEVLRHVARGKGSLEAGINWFASADADRSHFFAILEPKLENVPCQGQVRQVASVDAEAAPKAQGAVQTPKGSTAPQEEVQIGKGVCNKCGKLRRDHPNKQFCGMSKEMNKKSYRAAANEKAFRAREKEKRKAQQSEEDKNKKTDAKKSR